MFASIVDSQGNLVAVVNWQVETQDNGQVVDRFVDDNGNIFLERPQDELIDGIALINHLTSGANRFYQMQ